MLQVCATPAIVGCDFDDEKALADNVEQNFECAHCINNELAFENHKKYIEKEQRRKVSVGAELKIA
jgi:hypothetical protein